MQKTHSDSSPIEGCKLTATLAAFTVETRYEQIPAAAFESARQLILDTIGVALLASSHEIGRLIKAHAIALGRSDPAASLLGPGDLKVGAGFAAQANGTLANALDYDGGGHLPTHILPAVLALAEVDGLTGRDALNAFVIAYEGAARLTKVIDAKRKQHQGPTYRGWWHVGLIAPVAAALAACRARRADIETTARAIGVATASSAGFRRSMGTMTKALHSGNGARAGIEAEMLARRGFTGDPEILEAPLGFVSAITLPDERDAAPVMERLGRSFALEKPPGVKRFPAVSPSHGVIAAALQLAARGGFEISEIEKIEANYRTFSLERREARNPEEAGFCAPYLIAASLVRGCFGPEEIEPATILDPTIRRLSRRVVQVPKTTGEGNEVRITLRDGRVLSGRARGERAFDLEFIVAKFQRAAGKALNTLTAAELQDIVLHLDAQPTLTRLMRLARDG